jgi:hypothetical protein
MRSIFVVIRVVGSSLLAAGFVVSLSAQSRPIDQGSVTLYATGIRNSPLAVFYWETRLNPPTPPLSSGFGTAHAATSPDVVHRVLLDRTRKVYFGYNVRVEPQGANAYRLTLSPLTLTAELGRQLGDLSTWMQLPAPGFPAPRVLRGGEVLQLGLLTNEKWGQQVTEYITVQEAPPPLGFNDGLQPRREFSVGVGAARDFTVNDAELRLAAPRVSINGAFIDASAKAQGDDNGPIVWVYLPNRGRFLLSLTPHARQGFRRAGEARGSSLRFTVGKDVITIANGARVAPGQSAYNLYVLHQPAWKPTYANADTDAVILGSSDRVEDAITN